MRITKGVLLLILAAFVGVALASIHDEDWGVFWHTKNLCGPIGAHIAGALHHLFGPVFSWFWPLFIVFFAVLLFKRSPRASEAPAPAGTSASRRSVSCGSSRGGSARGSFSPRPFSLSRFFSFPARSNRSSGGSDTCGCRGSRSRRGSGRRPRSGRRSRNGEKRAPEDRGSYRGARRRGGPPVGERREGTPPRITVPEPPAARPGEETRISSVDDAPAAPAAGAGDVPLPDLTLLDDYEARGVSYSTEDLIARSGIIAPEHLPLPMAPRERPRRAPGTPAPG